MCHFISAILPASTDIVALASVAERHGRSLRPQNNPSVRKELNADENCFLTTAGHCDCGTPLGAHAASTPDDTRAQTRKLRLKGWSDAKISRWLEQRGEHRRQKTEAARISSEAGIAHWRAFLAEALARKDTPFVCLLIHLYSGALDGDIDLSGRRVVKLHEADSAFLGAMSEDVLYEFRP